MSKNDMNYETEESNTIGIKESDDLSIRDIILINQNQEIKDDDFNKLISQLPSELKIKYFCRYYYYSPILGVKFRYEIVGILKNKYIMCCRSLFYTLVRSDFSTEEYDHEHELFHGINSVFKLYVEKYMKKKDLCRSKRQYFHEFGEAIIPKVIINIIDDYLLWFDECINFVGN